MTGSEHDLVVVGGGIHGAGVAQAAAAAGYSVLVLERSAVAAGTSSRSSKLIHGGLRYLESGRFGLVRESLRERDILRRIAPGLVRLVPFHIPVYGSMRHGALALRAGLSLYALLGGGKRDNRFHALPRREWGDLDGLDTRGLEAVFRYFDGRTDDAALTRAVMRSAQTLGAELCCPANFLTARRVTDGFKVHYLDGGAERLAHARALVNAAGAWANDVLDRITPRPSRLTVDLVQGAHIVLEGELHRGVYYVEAPRDARAVFVMPWQGRTLVGTTETLYAGNPAAVHASAEEIAYLEETFRHYFPQRPAVRRDSFAGLRVLVRGEGAFSQRTRETVLHTDPQRHRLVTVYGGKLTVYRATAAKVLRLLKSALPPRKSRSDTAAISLEV
jgi:glycerol-3-phosphate dehydrogenase